MASKSDVGQTLQPLDLIFSCNICHASIRDICTPHQDEKGLDGVRRPVTKLWMTECAHLICAKHLEGGAPPFHPAGKAPRAVCPVCVARQNNHALRQMFAVSGLGKGEHDSEIPDQFFQCPPIALDVKDSGMDALRFQFLGLVTYGIAISTKFRSLQAAHDQLKDEMERLGAEKVEAETEIQALAERVGQLEATERKQKERVPEIQHYLRQFTRLKRELDRRNDDLRSLGYMPPQTDYTFPPSHLCHEVTSSGGKRTSHTDNATGQGAIDIPSVSSTTLRDEPQSTASKRQKISEFRYNPVEPMPPPAKSRSISAAHQKDDQSFLHPEPSPRARNNRREQSHTHLQSVTLPVEVSRIPKRRIQPVDDLTDVSSLSRTIPYKSRLTITPRITHHDETPNGPVIRADNIYTDYPEQDANPLPSRGIPTAYQGFVRPHRQPGYHNVPYRSPVRQHLSRPFTPSPQHIEAIHPAENSSVTSPFFRARQVGGRSRNNISSTLRTIPFSKESLPKYGMAPPQRPMQTSAPTQARTLNGLSFVQDPYLGSEYSSYDFDVSGFDHHHEAPRTSRDSQGFFIRPDRVQNALSAASARYETHPPQYHRRPQPLPSSTPSLASSINMAPSMRQPAQDAALTVFRGVKGASASSRGTLSGLVGSRNHVFSRAGRRSVRR